MQKISNIQFSATEEQEVMLWAEILAQRNRLLINSDWTQLPDARLLNRNEWTTWRNKVRKITKSTHTKETAKMELDNLLLVQPKVRFQYESDSMNLDQRKNAYIKTLNSLFKNKFEQYLPFEMNHYVMMEKFEEAMNLMDENIMLDFDKTLYPLIMTEVELTGKKVIEVAEEFISLKKLWLRAVVRAEKELSAAIQEIRQASNIEDLEEIMVKYL